MPATTQQLLAFDLGAESGRAIVGHFDGERLQLEVEHRFSNGPVPAHDSLYWDVLRLYQEMLNGLRLCAAKHERIESIGIDTWGVDFAFLGRGNVLLGNPRHYRDPHTEGVMEQAFTKVSREQIFQQTGVQFMRFNSLFQLLAMQRDLSPLLDAAESLLMIPDLLNFFLTGMKINEFSNVSTTQCYDPMAKNWAYGLLQAFDLPTKILGTIVQPGTVLGPLRTSVVQETGCSPIPVIAPATHDTGSAVAGVPAQGDSWAYVSSGTWSLMGVEIDKPLLTGKTQEYNFTNEGGVNGTIRLLKNVMGLWLVQECRRTWEKQGVSYDYHKLTVMAEAAQPFISIVNPDHESFILPQDMPKALASFCEKTGQPPPREPGAVVRCALDSLALRYRWVLERLEELTEKRLDVIHVVGGGCQNKLLCQLTADACNRVVLAGPVEATAIGNVMVQALGLGIVDSIEQARTVIRHSFPLEEYQPREPQSWDEPYQRFLKLLQADA